MDIEKLLNTLIKTIKNHKSILIYIKGSPDPDSLASSFALKIMCELHNVNADILSPAQISLNQNKRFMKALQIPVIFSEPENLSKYDSYAILDHQSAFINENISIPCCIHIDHHEITETSFGAEYRVLTNKVNSVSTLFAHFFKILNPDMPENIKRRLFSALLFGIQTDTDNLKLANEKDEKASEILTEFADAQFLEELKKSLYSEETLTIISKAIMNEEIYKNWLISGVGYLDQSNRDSIAIAADFLLERDDISVAVVYAIIEDKSEKKLFIDASFRTKNKSLDLNRLIKSITLNGGGRNYKGAYQVNLDYFFGTLNRKQLWEVTDQSTRNIIKDRRDNIKVIEIKSIFDKLKKHITILSKR